MRSNKETYEKVAENCSSYKPSKYCGKSCNKTSNSAADTARSCTNCSHFNHNGEYCEIDLYDKIVKDHNFDR